MDIAIPIVIFILVILAFIYGIYWVISNILTFIGVINNESCKYKAEQRTAFRQKALASGLIKEKVDEQIRKSDKVDTAISLGFMGIAGFIGAILVTILSFATMGLLGILPIITAWKLWWEWVKDQAHK